MTMNVPRGDHARKVETNGIPCMELITILI